jgi:hypothetical protein
MVDNFTIFITFTTRTTQKTTRTHFFFIITYVLFAAVTFFYRAFA